MIRTIFACLAALLLAAAAGADGFHNKEDCSGPGDRRELKAEAVLWFCPSDAANLVAWAHVTTGARCTWDCDVTATGGCSETVAVDGCQTLGTDESCGAPVDGSPLVSDSTDAEVSFYLPGNFRFTASSAAADGKLRCEGATR